MLLHDSNVRKDSWYFWKKAVLLIADDKKELEDIKKRNSELSEKMMEKNRQYLKLQVNT